MVELAGYIDSFPSTTEIAGWARIQGAVSSIPAEVRLCDDTGVIALASADIFRPDLKGHFGFRLKFEATPRVTLPRLESGQTWVEISHAEAPGLQRRATVWSGVKDPRLLLRPTEVPRAFWDHLRGLGLALSVKPNSLPPWGTRFSVPSVVQYSEIGGEVEVGAFTGIFGRERGLLYQCKIGRFCSFGDGYCIGLPQHPANFISSSMFFYMKNVHGWDDWLAAHEEASTFERSRFSDLNQVEIGNDVWVGANVVIKRGVKIGDGAIIGAGAVVLKDVPPYAIVGGVPAKILRMRFPDHLIEKLLETQWWNYNVASLKGLDPADVEASIDLIASRIESGDLQPFKSLEAKYIYEYYDEWLEKNTSS